MAVVGSEKTILKRVAELRQATKFQLHQQTGLSLDYVEYLCRFLVREGYLRQVGQGSYALAPAGKKIMVSLGYEFALDKASIKELAGQVAKEVSKAIKIKGVTSEITKRRTAYREPGEERRKIEIKTDYLLPVEDETIGLESNIGKVGPSIEKEGAEPIDASVKLLKSFSKIKSKK